MVGVALLVFPKLALGLSGFETGVAVMPHVKGDAGDTEDDPAGRIRGTKQLLTTAAVIMSVFLITTSFITTLLIPQTEFQPGGQANGRALAYLAHEYLGSAFGTVYDVSHHRHPVVRRRLRDGRPAQPDARATCRATAWPRTGPAPCARWCSSSPLIALPGHLDLRRRRRRPGRRLRHRRAGADHLGRRSP